VAVFERRTFHKKSREAEMAGDCMDCVPVFADTFRVEQLGYGVVELVFFELRQHLSNTGWVPRQEVVLRVQLSPKHFVLANAPVGARPAPNRTMLVQHNAH
jgi:hypothetical protein